MNHLVTFLKGFAMGAANVIPGVSGGTIAFITGIYERLINALKSIDLQAVRLLCKLDLGGFAKKVDLVFLASLAMGVVISVLTLAKVLKGAYTSSPIIVNAFFFGLILASIFSVGRMVKKWRSVEIVALLIGVAMAVSLAFLSPAAENKNLIYLGLCGVVGMCSMIIPGISGSFILLLMGNYQLIILDAINNLRQMRWVDALTILIPVGLGAVVGLVVLSHVLSWLFRKFHDTATALIAGFVAGSLVVIWPWKTPIYLSSFPDKVISWNRYAPDLGQSETWLAAAWLVGGVAIITITEKWAAKKNG